MIKLVFDPGHGGRDPGAVGANTKEKDNNLNLAIKTAEILNHTKQFKINFTRDKDMDFCPKNFSVEEDLKERVEDANVWGGAAFVSFHNNSAVVKAYGNEVFAWQPGGEAEKLAKAVNARMAAQLGMVNRGVKFSGLYVCRKTDMPAILIEYGFINSEELTILANMDKAALAIAQGIGDYFGIEVKGESGVLKVAVLMYTDEDYWAAKDVSKAKGNAAMFVRSADRSVPADAMAAEHLIVIGGSTTGHKNETLLSGQDKYDTAAKVKNYLGGK